MGGRINTRGGDGGGCHSLLLENEIAHSSYVTALP